MNAQVSLPELTAAVLQEDRARADFYALISRLFYAGPDAGLLAAIAAAEEITGEAKNVSLAEAWKSLISAATAMDAKAAQEEYDNVFVGTGKAEITPYAAHYLAESMQDRVLVRLRQKLEQMGLARAQGTPEYEDHMSGLCEVMRHLIAAGSSDAAAQQQKRFFLEYLLPWYADFCAAVMASPNTNFYKHVACFTSAFLDLELYSFEMT